MYAPSIPEWFERLIVGITQITEDIKDTLKRLSSTLSRFEVSCGLLSLIGHAFQHLPLIYFDKEICLSKSRICT